MCSIIFFVADKTHPDPIKDRRGCPKKGMPAVVHEDGHVFGREESKQRWLTESRYSGPVTTSGTDVIFNAAADYVTNMPGVCFLNIGAETRRIVGTKMVASGSVVFILAVVETPFSVDYSSAQATVTNDPTKWPGQGMWAIVHLTGVPVSQALALLDPQTEDDTGVETGGTFRFCRWRFAFETLPAPAQNALIADGEYTSSVPTMSPYFRRVRDNAQYPGF